MDNFFWDNIKEEMFILNQMRRDSKKAPLKLKIQKTLEEEKRLKKEIAKKVTRYLLENGDYGVYVTYNVNTEEIKVQTLQEPSCDYWEEISLINLENFFENWLGEEIEKRLFQKEEGKNENRN